MTQLETLLENPATTLAVLDVEAPDWSVEPELVGANRFGNGPFSNWDNWTRFGNN